MGYLKGYREDQLSKVINAINKWNISNFQEAGIQYWYIEIL